MTSNLLQASIKSDADVAIAVKKAQMILQSMGFSRSPSFLIATAVSELARNALVHANGGTLTLQKVTNSKGSEGIKLIMSDCGPGIPDTDRAFETGYSTANSLGLGLPGVKRIMDDVTISSRVCNGCIVTAHKWK